MNSMNAPNRTVSVDFAERNANWAFVCGVLVGTFAVAPIIGGLLHLAGAL